MCLSCRRLWTAVQALWSTLYVTSGGALLTAGVFFAISLPEHLHLYGTLCAGAWNIIIGIAGGMVACISDFSPKRQESLLYMAVSILVVNCINLTLMEYWFYVVDVPKLLGQYTNHLLIEYACFVTRIASAVVLVVAFLDSQFSFCSMQSAPKPQGPKKVRGSHEQVSDIEYIIPRPKNSKPSPQPPYDAYAQSWVFDAENNASCSNSKDHGGYFRVVQNGTPKKPSSGGGRSTRGMHNGIVKETSHLIDNPVVQIEEASDDSNSGRSDRKLCYMKSFSRSQSPVALSSASSSQVSLDAPPPHEGAASDIVTAVVSPPAIYQCLEKLTEPTIYRTRLNTALSSKDEDYYQAPQAIVMRKVEATSPRVEKVQYASLMKELQKAIISKKDPPSVTSPQSNASDSDKTHTTSKSSSRSEGQKSSDADFSKELEAALQLIQDLESPNTVETPSDAVKSPLVPPSGAALAVWRGSDVSESSDKTLSAVGSLAEMTSPMSDGQPAGMTELLKAHQQAEVKGIVAAPTGWPLWNHGSIPVHYPDSQSTSGYSSPTQGPTPNWSTTSSVSGSNPELKPTSYSIRNTDSSTVISLYSSTPIPAKSRSVTMVKITSDEPRQQTLTTFRPQPPPQSNWKLNSLLRKKKHVGLPPELESAIIKSESLAYLTDLELLARHQRNQEMQRVRNPLCRVL
ncbi:unnamed protein product [Callosobruchus maculatus]|nr:unnamed protein product [Callosobruchus maculatus]